MSKAKKLSRAGKNKSLDGYLGQHRAGSRKGEVHKAFDLEGPAAAKALARKLGLSESTFPSWAVSFRRQADAGNTLKPARSPVNLSLDSALVAEAKDCGANISRAAEIGIAAEIARIREERWLHENQASIESSNAYMARRGLPLEKYRMF